MGESKFSEMNFSVIDRESIGNSNHQFHSFFFFSCVLTHNDVKTTIRIAMKLYVLFICLSISCKYICTINIHINKNDTNPITNGVVWASMHKMKRTYCKFVNRMIKVKPNRRTANSRQTKENGQIRNKSLQTRSPHTYVTVKRRKKGPFDHSNNRDIGANIGMGYQLLITTTTAITAQSMQKEY